MQLVSRCSAVSPGSAASSIFNAPDRATAEAWLAATVKKYETSASQLADWLETNLLERLIVFSFPKIHQRRLQTANLLERLNKEFKQRTRVVGIFPSEIVC